MDFTPRDDSLDFEESLYQESSPPGPTRARRRQSDAKWRASVATCYDTLKHVVPKGHQSSKGKVSKAMILQASERHIMHLENVLSRLLGSESQAIGKTVMWKGDNQWNKCTLKHFQEDFAEKQHKIFHSSNQGRRCYNLLDEIKEEIFSMSVDPNSLSIVDSVAVTRCVEKVNGKEVSRFSQFPINQIVKSKEKIPTATTKASGKPADTTKNRPSGQKIKEKSSNIDGYLSNEIFARSFEREDQIVPSISSSIKTLSQRSTSTLSSKAVNGHSGYTVHVAGHYGGSTVMGLDDNEGGANEIDDGDQEVPSYTDSNVSHKETSVDLPVHIRRKLSYVIEDINASTSSQGGLSKKTLHVNTTPTPATKNELENDGIKTPANTVCLETFKSKYLDSSPDSRFKTLTENGKDPTKKPKTARKLNFNRPECVGGQHKLTDHQSTSLGRGMSPMLAGFTPIKLSPSASYCITCKRPDESLVSPWKPFHSPLYGDSGKKPQEKSPMIDPDNSLFCFETMDDSIMDSKDGIDDEKTPAFHCLTEDDNPAKQAFKRKITCKSFDLMGKHQPKCRKKLDGFFDSSVCKALTSSSMSSCSKSSNGEAHVVPDCTSTASQQEEKRERENDGVAGVTKLHKDCDDAVDFDGFFFYFRQIGQQLKDQQKLSSKEIQSPSVAAKVMKMWMRLPSPDKQTIKTLALLDSQEVCPTFQESVGDLSQDLQDVDVEPIDLKEFIPTTPV